MSDSMTPSLSEQALLDKIVRLEQELADLREEKADLEIILDLITEHSDTIEAMLEKKARAFLQEKLNLETLLKTAMEHSDAFTTNLRNKAEAAVHESERRLAKFMEAVPVGVYVVNAEGRPYYANKMALQILGTENLPQGDKLDGAYFAKRMAREILEHTLGFDLQPAVPPSAPDGKDEARNLARFDLLYACNPHLAGSGRPYPLAAHPLFRALRGECATVEDMEIHRDAKTIPLEVWATPIFDENGEVLHAIAVLQDITQRKHAEAERLRYIQEVEVKNAALRMNEKLQAEIHERKKAEAALHEVNQELARLARLDSLTQVANRRHLDEYLDLMWRQLARDRRPLGLMLCDVDYFKRYNDIYGHQAGDDCLYRVAQALQKCARRPIDLAARYGGEEFVLLLPYTDITGTVLVATQFNEALRALEIPHTGSEVSAHVTASLGVSCTVPVLDTAPDKLIAAADAALYEAKHQGRNQVRSKAL